MSVDITLSNYHSPEIEREWLSASQLMAWRHCEAAAAARYLHGMPAVSAETGAQLTGRYLAARWAGEEHFRDLVAATPELFRRDGGLRAEFAQCEEMYARTAADTVFRHYLTGTHWRIIAGELFGVPWKSRIEVDNEEENFVTDLMVCRDFAPVWQPETGSRVPFYAARNAYLRLGLHQLAVRQATGREPELYLAAVTRQTPADLKVVAFNNPAARQVIAEELALAAEQVRRIKAIRNGDQVPRRCNCCDHCRATRQLEGCEDAA